MVNQVHLHSTINRSIAIKCFEYGDTCNKSLSILDSHMYLQIYVACIEHDMGSHSPHHLTLAPPEKDVRREQVNMSTSLTLARNQSVKERLKVVHIQTYTIHLLVSKLLLILSLHLSLLRLFFSSSALALLSQISDIPPTPKQSSETAKFTVPKADFLFITCSYRKHLMRGHLFDVILSNHATITLPI